jgi:hypothetical protein
VGRYFGKTPGEWAALPWWVQRAYLEGLQQDGVIEMSYNSSVNNFFAPIEQFADLGITVRP